MRQSKLSCLYRNDTIIAFFFVANKNEDNATVALVSFSDEQENSRFELTTNSTFCSKQETVILHGDARRTTIFCAKLKAGDTNCFTFFTFCYVIWFWELYIPFRECLMQSPLLDFIAFPVNLHCREDSKIFPAC